MPTNSSRVHLEQFVKQAAASVPAGSRVLDAGAGMSPYRHHFAHAVYESADFMQVVKPYAEDITYVGDLGAVDAPDETFDLVLLTQVLEHLPEPVTVLTEMRRLLKPGGQVWASTPLFYEEHEQPHDFFRYTQFGLRHIFERAGFTDVRIEWLEGYLGTLAYELQVVHKALPRKGAARVAVKPVRALLDAASEALARSDVRKKRTGSGHPKNYTIIART